MRVVSLLPSATEVLCAIGADELLVGRSHECDFPMTITDRPVLTAQKTTATTSAAIDEQVRDAMSSGEATTSLYMLDADALRDCRPDVILTQDLCDVCSIDLATVRGVVATMDPAPTIVSLDPKSIEDVFDDVLAVGQAIDRTDDAERAMVDLRDAYWTAVDYVNPYVSAGDVAFLEWMDPIFVGGHWTPQLIEAAGAMHPLNQAGASSRQVEWSAVLDMNPSHLIVCPCGYDLDAIQREMPDLETRPGWSDLPAVRDGRVMLVDGNQMFNRPGPRLVTAFRWLVSWLQDRPEVRPAGFPAVPWTSSDRTRRP